MSATTDRTPDISASLSTLPSPPYVAMEIIRLTNDQASSSADLANVLNQDPVLAARVLQMANSPAYGLSREVSTVERATTLLGLKAVKLMALSFSLASDMSASTGALSVATYWYRSLFNAVTARRWAELMAPGLAEEAFLAGLLSHIGRLVLAEQRPAEYAELLASEQTDWPTLQAERDEFGFSSADVTVALLEEWGLPELVTSGAGVMYRRQKPDPAIAGASELSTVLQNVAITERALCHGEGPEAVARLHSAVEAAGVDGAEVEPFVVELEARIRDLAEVLDVELPEGLSHADMLNQARTRLVEVSLETVHDLESVEAQADELRQRNDRLEGLAFHDHLTGVPNRASFDEHLTRVIAAALRSGNQLVGMIMLDIDRFKAFNDTYGHQVGDEVLRQVAAAMKSVSRTDEMLARYGGEEFALVAINCTIDDIVVVGERLRAAVAALRIPTHAGEVSVTVSGGAAVIQPTNIADGERLVHTADAALYEAKAAGRNQIQIAR